MASITPSNTPPDKGLHQHEEKENKIATNPDLKATIENQGAEYKDRVFSSSERTVALHEYPDLADPVRLFTTLKKQPEDWKDPLVRMHVARVANIMKILPDSEQGKELIQHGYKMLSGVWVAPPLP